MLAGPPSEYLPMQSVAPDHPVARDDERHRVVAERGADRAHGPRPADLGGDPAVRPDLAARDLEGLGPDIALERRLAAQVERDPRPPIAGEPSVDGRAEPVGSAATRWAARPNRSTCRRSKVGPSGACSTVDTPRPLNATKSGPIGESIAA